MNGPFQFPEDAPAPPAAAGGKARALWTLRREGRPVPAFCVLPAGAAWTGGQLDAALARLGPGPYAVRSSAAAEDSADHSFAGQFVTHLFVPAERAGDRVRDVQASAARAAVGAYREARGVGGAAAVGVVIQRMAAAARSGVAFSADPVSGRRTTCVVAAVHGAGTGLVSGALDADTWRVGPDGAIAERTIVAKTVEHVADPGAPEGVAGRPLPEALRDAPVLSDAEVAAVAALARDAERLFGLPQDIEWALDAAGTLHLLQSRPVTTLRGRPDPDDELRLWDNANIAESYTGVTTPLTFSFARRVYEHVYIAFCRLMGVGAGRIARRADVFPNMLGLVRGRIYYNLLNWYRVLALLPGFTLNRRFMETMMGVKEPLPDELVERVAAGSRVAPWADRLAVARGVAGLLLSFATLPARMRRFRARLDAALAPPGVPLERLRGTELVALYRRMEADLLLRWDAPLVNDFFAMLFHGVLRALCGRWAGDAGRAAPLLADAGGIVSAEPPRRIRRMAVLASQVPGLAAALGGPAPVAEKLTALRGHAALAAAFDLYLRDFGDRCIGELKLESPTVGDDPGALLAAIGARALAGDAASTDAPAPPPAVPPALSGLRRPVFAWVLRQTRARVRDRENLRFERTRLFGRVRAVLRELGRRLAAEGVIDAPADVFWLTLEEGLGAYDGVVAAGSLAAVARARRAEFAAYRAGPPPPDRFETRGPVLPGTPLEPTRVAPPPAGEAMKGVGACPGVVRGRVRVVTDPAGARLEPGEILAAQQTDPGWVVLFPAASGLLVERGSLLSHSAIVARELNLPCVVSLTGLCAWLRTGDEVEMDGSTGRVTRVRHAE